MELNRKSYAFGSAALLLKICEEEHIGMDELLLRREEELFERKAEVSLQEMAARWQVMKHAAREAVHEPKPSLGGLIGGEAKALSRHLSKASTSFLSASSAKAAVYALSVMEVNAAMGRIVAAPTAGSAGVIPAAFLAVQEDCGYTDEAVVRALFVAAGIGLIITSCSSVSGAEGGCQAEIGSASAMAAAGLVYLGGGSARQSCEAASGALANLLGLVCDPVAGLVELPCQRRNVIGAENALACAEMSLAGIPQAIPLDEMITALDHVGRSLPLALRETALGGTAATATGQAIRAGLYGENTNGCRGKGDGGNAVPCAGCGACS